MRLFAALITLLFCFCGISAQKYNCEKLKDEEITLRSYPETIVIRENKIYQSLGGIIVIGNSVPIQETIDFLGNPANNVFVEIFTKKNGNRIAGCRTNESGMFGFSDLPEGSYILRLSKDGGFKVTDIYIKVSPKSKNNSEIMCIIYSEK